MMRIAIKYKPNYVCIVPEKRAELTTEGGLNVNRNFNFLKKFIEDLKNHGMRVALFIEPTISDIVKSKKLGANCIELHTGKFCNLVNQNKNFKNEILKLKKAANHAQNIGLAVHAGHGLTYKSTLKIKSIKAISEFNIGHFIISESIFTGLKDSIVRFRKILKSK